MRPMHLPPRDRKFSLFFIGVFAALTASSLSFCFYLDTWLCWIGSGGLSFFLMNHFVLRRSFFSYDRILSAVSPDGLNWHREAGVRLDVGGLHQSSHVYFPRVVAVPGGLRMYYRAGGYGAVIGSAFSRDGLCWEEEEGVRVGTGGEHRLVRIDGPSLMSPAAGELFLYYGGTDGIFWRIYQRQSRDGLLWEGERACIDVTEGSSLPNAMQPSTVKFGDGYHLYFTRFSTATSHFYVAFSEDGLYWRDIRPCAGYRAEGYVVRTPCVVPLPEGALRMYFSEYPVSERLDLESRIVSATSQDGCNWVREPGVRLAPEGPHDRQGVFCPEVIAFGEQWRMYYGGYLGRHWLEPYTLFKYRSQSSAHRLLRRRPKNSNSR